MDTVVLAVYDVQAQAYHKPIFVPSRGVGVRMCSDECNRQAQDNVLYQHPEDFRLFELGTWDEASGLFTCHNVPELVCDVSSLRTKTSS